MGYHSASLLLESATLNALKSLALLLTLTGLLSAQTHAAEGFVGGDTCKACHTDEFAAWDAALAEGDSVVFIPPVAGG